MLNAFRKFIDSLQTAGDAPVSEADHEKALRVATTALLVELSRADFGDTQIEDEVILGLLERGFSLDAAAARAMLEEADGEAKRAVSLQEFTSMLHEHMTPGDKLDVIEMLWRVAYADDKLDPNEEYLVRKLADLLYVSHTDLIRLRNKVAG
ncbi:MAG: TerB family tellurite resistance protein, partial [Pseudomonadota bacterium]